MNDENEEVGRSLAAAQRIAWVLANDGFSHWLKSALRAAQDRDPVSVLNDLEMMNHLLKPWAAEALRASPPRQSPLCPPHHSSDV